MNENNNNSAILGALGYGALPQSIVPVTKTQTQIQRTQYEPNKLNALISALKAPRMKQQIEKNKWEILGNALANNITSPTYEGAYGVKFTNPITDALARGVNVFNDIYGTQQQQKRDLANQDVELQNQAREDAIKAAQLEAEASKQNITDQITRDYIKINDPNAKGGTEQQQNMYNAAVEAIKTLDDLAKNGGIWSGNKSTDNWWLSEESSKNIGRREAALSALIPITNQIAKATGGSGINTLGEMMAYLGIPENATSAQIKGALNGIINKMPAEVQERVRKEIHTDDTDAQARLRSMGYGNMVDTIKAKQPIKVGNYTIETID